MDPPAKIWGTTAPISLALPTPAQRASNEELIKELKRQNNFESPAETERRNQTLKFFQAATTKFVRNVLERKGLAPAVLDAAGGKVLTYGSYRLGVYGPGSDIDTLIVAPKNVEIEDFFSDFPPVLEQMAPPGALEKLTPVPDAYVPIINIEYSGIKIDLIFARLQLASIPINLDLKNTDLLRGLDSKEVRCVNGARVTDEILELVPEKKTFRLALRAIKLWAQRRAIYSNIVGFPGGVAWAMLVARVCQLYPYATSSVIIEKFFFIIANWPWPSPVTLKNIESGPLKLQVWNPQIYPSDKYHLMPIITPAYPSMCATHNVSQSTKAVLVRELSDADELVRNIVAKKAVWGDLFARHSFFTKDYRYYLSIVSSSTNPEAQSVWSGLVQSKLRHLVNDLDRNESIAIAHPFPKGFTRVHTCRTPEQIFAVKNGSTDFQAKDTQTQLTDETNDPRHIAMAVNNESEVQVKSIDPAAKVADDSDAKTKNGNEDEKENEKKPESEVDTNKQQEKEGNNDNNSKDEVTTLYTTTYYIGLQIQPARSGTQSLDISPGTQKFIYMCTSWDKYVPGVNDIQVTHMRSWSLPDDVFDENDVRPVRQPRQKKRKARPQEDPSSATTASPEKHPAKRKNMDFSGEQQQEGTSNKRHASTFPANS